MNKIYAIVLEIRDDKIIEKRKVYKYRKDIKK